MSTTKPPSAATNPSTTKSTTTRPTQQQQVPQLSPYPPRSPIPHTFHLYPSLNLRPPTNPNPNPNHTTTTTSPHNNLPPHQLYPLASSGRGFVHRSFRPPDHNAGAFNPHAALALPYRPPSSPQLDPGLAHLHQLPHRSHPYPYPVHLVRQTQPVGTPSPRQHPVSGPRLGRGIPLTGAQVKVAPSPVSDSNGYKNSRERSREDNVVTVRGRKVRIVDGASLYTLCRSWLRNGQPEDSQPDNADSLKSLPRPLPLAAVEGNQPSTKEGEEVEEDEEDEESVDHLSPEDLLKRHIMRAKKVRARLREERLRRIARYKTRLALLLPPQGEQFRNDTAAVD